MTFILTKSVSSGGTGSSIAGLAIVVINGQPMLTLEDTTRGNKILSVAENVASFAENALGNNDWVRVGNANDADSGFIADFDGTLVSATAHCENTNANSKDIDFYINNTNIGTIGALAGGANATFINTILNVDFNQGDRIRLRAVNGIPGPIQDTVIKLTLKWRG